MFKNLNFGKTRFKNIVFEKHFISYSCILFEKYYALRSFCIKLLCFSKNWFFLNFDQSNLFLDRSKLRLKVLAWLCVFRLIEPMFWSIKSRIKSFFFFNKKKWVSHVLTIQIFFLKTFYLSIRSVQGSKQDFCRFQPNFFKGFCHLRPVRPLYPSFFFYFQFLCIFVMHLGLFSNLREIGIFGDSSFFFGNCSIGFCCWII